MDGPSRRMRRRALGFAAALATLALGAGTAAAGPTADVGASWTGNSDQAGAGRIVAEPNAIYGAFGTQLQVGDRHGHRYCNAARPRHPDRRRAREAHPLEHAVRGRIHAP